MSTLRRPVRLKQVVVHKHSQWSQQTASDPLHRIATKRVNLIYRHKQTAVEQDDDYAKLIKCDNRKSAGGETEVRT